MAKTLSEDKANAALIIEAVNSYAAHKARIKALEDLLKTVAKTVRESDCWWMDMPDRGGFDLAAIDAALASA